MSDAEDEQKSEGFVSKKQHLFLVEFLIDIVNLDPQGFSEEIMEGQTCITLKFLNFPPMNICEKDFDRNKEPGIDKIRFNSGKSLMFAFSEKQCEDPPIMLAEAIVGKKLSDDNDSNIVNIGRIKICMIDIFQQVYEIAKFAPDKLPASKSIKDCFMLVGRGKRTVGEIGIYIRLTCLGQNVVTEFQCGANIKQDPVLFKNRDGKKVYEFSGAIKDEEEEGEEETEGTLKVTREGCGCLNPPPPSPSRFPGGQGDAGSGRRTSVGGTYTRGNRIVHEVPHKPNHGKGEQKADRKQQMECQNLLNGTLKSKDGVTASQVNTNPEENCFVLKVGDKGQIPDRGKMILEFRTPKQKIIPKVLPPYHEDVAVQTDSGKKKKNGKGRKK